MVQAQRSLTGTGAAKQSSPVPLDWRQNSFEVTIRIDTDGSTTGATVQGTLDNVWTVTATDVKWFNVPAPTATIWPVTADTVVNLTGGPIRAVRLGINSSGTDTITMDVLQS